MNVCAKCTEPGFRFRGDRWLCVLHNRFDTMRECARSKGKTVPTFEQLEDLAAATVAAGMKCPTCDVLMVWHGTNGRSTVVSLQHDRSGRIRFLCLGCNMRHATFPGDSFYEVPKGWRYCWRCKTAKPPEDFYRNKAGACCKACRKTLNAEMWAAHGRRWAANSRERKATANETV